MYVIEVMPLLKGVNIDTLSYFSGQRYKVGTFLTVPIRNKARMAMVTGIKDVSQEKTNIRSADFSLQRLPKQTDTTVLPDCLIKTATELTKDYPASVGLLLYHLLSPDIRSGKRQHQFIESEKNSQNITPPKILTASYDERMHIYQNLIRTSLANNQSVLIVTPTSYIAEVLSKKLATGITKRLITISGNLPKKQLDKHYEQTQDTNQAKIIIAPPAYSYIYRKDITTIIIEESASQHYVTKHKPYLDHRIALRHYARFSDKKIILADTVPLTEDEFKRRQGEYDTYDEPVKRIDFFTPLTIILQKDKPKINIPFKLLSNDTISKVNSVLEQNGRVFLYAARRGLAPLVNCIDCGFIFRCPDSGAPYSLIRIKKNGLEERWFVSATSGRKIKAADTCQQCGSWRLRERGLGAQYVYDEWTEMNSNTPTFLLDNLTANTIKKAKEIASDFLHTPGSVLIGTQLSLPFIYEIPDLSIITSLDAARSIPSWRADEFIFKLILKLREHTKQETIVQTRSTPDNLLLWAKRGEIEKFYNEEIPLRKMLNYPPFSTFILLSWRGNSNAVKKQESELSLIFNEENIQYYNDSASFDDKIIRHALIKILPNITDNKKTELMTKLRRLPPEIKIEINPDKIV